MITQIGLFLNKFTNYFGLEIHRHLPYLRAGSIRSMKDVCLQAKRCGMNVNTIFDVGVAEGTYELYECFPEAQFVLVEPLVEFDNAIEAISKKYTVLKVQAAASDYSGKTNIILGKKSLHGSSLFSPRGDFDINQCFREINTITLDCLAVENPLRGPFLIKADVQGAELNVVKGSKKILQETEMVILETSLYEFQTGIPQIYDVITSMRDYGFVVYDFIGGAVRPLDGALGQIDIAFVKEWGLLRKIHGYA